MNDISRGILIKMLAIGFFAVMDALMKELTGYYGNFQVTFFRGLVAMPFVLILIAYKGNWSTLKTSQIKLHLIRAVLAVTMLASFVYAFAHMPLADAYAIFFAAPLFVTFLSIVILKETVGWHRWLALLVGLGGVMFILKPGSAEFSLASMICLLATISYAFVMILVKLLSKHDSVLTMSFYFTLAVIVGGGVMAIPDWQPVRLQDSWLLLGLGISGASAQLLMTQAYHMAPASRLAPFEYTSMIWALLIGWVFFQELPTPHMMIGAAIVAMTGLYILHRERVHQLESKEKQATRS